MKNVKNTVFLGFDLEDIICVNFHGHICNQQVEIRRYTKFQSDCRYLASRSTPNISNTLNSLKTFVVSRNTKILNE